MRSVLAELVKRCIDIRRSADKPKHLAALQAVVADHATEAERFFTDKLGTLVANADDASLVHVVDLVARVPLAWTCLPTVQREKLGRFVLASPDMRVAEAMNASPSLLQLAVDGVASLSDVALSTVAMKSKNTVFLAEIVRGLLSTTREGRSLLAGRTGRLFLAGAPCGVPMPRRTRSSERRPRS